MCSSIRVSERCPGTPLPPILAFPLTRVSEPISRMFSALLYLGGCLPSRPTTSTRLMLSQTLRYLIYAPSAPTTRIAARLTETHAVIRRPSECREPFLGSGRLRPRRGAFQSPSSTSVRRLIAPPGQNPPVGTEEPGRY